MNVPKQQNITIDKLYKLHKEVKETKKFLSHSNFNNKLIHWSELLDMLITTNGDKAFEELKSMREQQIDKAKDVLEHKDSFDEMGLTNGGEFGLQPKVR